MLLHDPSRASDNRDYWGGSLVMYKGLVSHLVGVTATTADVQNNTTTDGAVPLSSELLSVPPIVAQYIDGDFKYNKAERRKRKGYAGASGGLYGCTSSILVAGEPCRRRSDGHVQLYGINVGTMSTDQYREYLKEFRCQP